MNRLNLKELHAHTLNNIVFDRDEKEYIERLATSPMTRQRRQALDYMETSLLVRGNRDFILTMAHLLIPDQNNKIRWRTLSMISCYIKPFPSKLWPFIVNYGTARSKDLRLGVACCLLEHLLEHHFESYFSRIEKLLYKDSRFIYTLQNSRSFITAEQRCMLDRMLEEDTNHTKWTHDKLLSRAFIPAPRHESQELSSGRENEIMKGIKEVERNIKEADADD